MVQLDDNFDPEKLRWKGEAYVTPSIKPRIEPKTKPRTEKRNRPKTRFIPPMFAPWIAEATKLSGHSIHVAVIMYLHGKGCDGESILTDSHFEPYGISEKAVRFGLDVLQQAGLIKYHKDGNEYRITPKPIEPQTWFIAPIPALWITEATKLPAYAVRVALAIRYARGMAKREVITLRRRYHFNPLNISRGQVQRGMEELQQAGLIRYIKDANSYVVTILPVKPEDSTENDQNAARASC